MPDEPVPTQEPETEPIAGQGEDATARADALGGTPQGIGPPMVRGCLFLPAWIIIGSVLGFPILFGILAFLEPGIGMTEPLVQVGLTAASYPLMIMGILLLWKFTDRATMADLGYVGGAMRVSRGLVGGFVVGAVILSSVLLVGLALGTHRVDLGRSFGADVLSEQLLLFFGLAIAAHFEEVLFRGYLLQNLFRKRPMLSLVLSSLPFALIHLGNPNVFDEGKIGAALITLNIVLAGMWLGSAFILCKDLWLPTGLHLGWNWAMSALYGVPVSGMEFQGLLTTTVDPNSGLVGGVAFGLEGTFTCTIVMALLAGRGVLRIHREGRHVPVVENYPATSTPHSAPPPGSDRIESAESGA